jgi:hypothetical protein
VCGVHSLKGRYGFQASGRVDVPVKAGARVDLAKTETIHFAQVGTLEADGEGNALIKVTSTGHNSPPATSQSSAVYTVNSDCTGTIRYLLGDPEVDAAENGPGYAFVLTPDNTFSFISTITNMVLTGSAWQISDSTGEPVPVGAATTLRAPLSLCGIGCPPGQKLATGSFSCIPC